MSGGGSGNESGDVKYMGQDCHKLHHGHGGATPGLIADVAEDNDNELRYPTCTSAKTITDARITFNFRFRQKRAEARAKRLGTAVQYERPPKRPCCRRTYELDSKRQREDDYSSWEDQLYDDERQQQKIEHLKRRNLVYSLALGESQRVTRQLQLEIRTNERQYLRTSLDDKRIIQYEIEEACSMLVQGHPIVDVFRKLQDLDKDLKAEIKSMEDIKEARLAQLELENNQSIIDLRNAQAQLILH
jgi:hypothetical protein